MKTQQSEVAAVSPRSTDLLSLLKFRQSSTTAATLPADSFSAPSPPSNNGLSSFTADNLVHQSPPIQSSPAHAPAADRHKLRGQAISTSANPQDFLLKLLNQVPNESVAGLSSPARSLPLNTFKSDDSVTGRLCEITRRLRSPTSVDHQLSSANDTRRRETVSQVLSGVGEVVDKQAGTALAQATIKARDASMLDASQNEQDAANEEAANVKADFKDNEESSELNGGMPKDVPLASQKMITAVVRPTNTEEDWEQPAEKIATTFTLPMQPFKAIHISQLESQLATIPSSMTMDIARVKRSFDQIDRNLVTATQNLMVYPLKNGGLRVIRQETGVHKEVFKQIPERIFSVSVSATKKPGAPDTELVLGTGVEGSVFWAPLSNFAASDDAETERIEAAFGFVFPPVSSSEENTSGGQLKTRVKPSSRHPEFFAYGRGKSIYIVYPEIACSAAYSDYKTHLCKSEKYLKEHMLRISTGKAGKDFIFSADDSLILSLDKAGRLKFWDIRNLILDGYERRYGAATPLDIKVPLMTLATCPAAEKSWPTSIHLVDKEKPMHKGIALRYVIIGLKQNHTLQLWDLALGKPVQEIIFPHELESDAICSVVFHARTSILTVAHPTRNSIYFMHLSIPPYSLSPMSQSKFVSSVAEKNDNLPQPQSTIIVNGIREYKFSHAVTIRSLDILSEPGSHYGDDGPSFVLYVMHSNGIMELKVDRAMLGLGETNRLIDGVSALDLKNVIKVETIKALPPAVAGDTGSVTSEAALVTPVIGIKEARKPGRRSEQTLFSRAQKLQETESSNDKHDKKRKKENKEQSPEKGPVRPSFTPLADFIESAANFDPSKSQILTRKQPELLEAEAAGFKVITKSDTVMTASQAASSTVSASATIDFAAFEALVRSEFTALSDIIHQDRLKIDVAAATRQEAVLEAVSRTLTENIEHSLSRIVTEGLTTVTVNPLKDVVASTIDRQLSTSFNHALNIGVPCELQKSLPVAISQVLMDKDVLRTIAIKVSQSVVSQVDSQIMTVLQNTIAPAISKLAISAIQQMTSDAEHRFSEQLIMLEKQKQVDNSAITSLSDAVKTLQQTVLALSQSMEQHQQTLAQEVTSTRADLKAFVSALRPVSASPKPVTSVRLALSRADQERQDIQDAFARGEVEEATLKWMHSEQKTELFDSLFLHVNPRFVGNLSPLLVLSVAATVSEGFDSQIRERLTWIDMCLLAMSSAPNPQELQDVLPNVLDVILQRIQQSYMQVSQVDFQDPILKNMHHVARKIGDLKATMTA